MAVTLFHVCYHCKERHVGCHAKCIAYQKEVEENQRRKANARREKSLARKW